MNRSPRVQGSCYARPDGGPHFSTLYLRLGTDKRNYLQFGNRAPNRLPAALAQATGPELRRQTTL
jgi:hypothetical protein